MRLKMIKNNCLIKEETVQTSKMLPQFYIDYLKTYLPSSELLTLQILGKANTAYIVKSELRGSHLAFLIPLNVKAEGKRYKDFYLYLD